MPRVLITGGLGFVGSACVERFVNAGHDVEVFDDGSRGNIRNVDASRVRWIQGRLGDLEALSAAVGDGGFDAVVHLAAMHFIPDCNRDPQACLRTNVVGTENLLAACAAAGVPRVVAASSMAVYPISDEATKESDPVGPYDVYGESKVANEMQISRWAREQAGRTAVAVRLSNAYGPRETNPHVIPEILAQLAVGARSLQLGNTTPYRDYVHVDDVAAGLLALVETDLEPGYHVFNLGSGVERSVDGILEVLAELIGHEITTNIDPERVRVVERMHLLPDISALTGATGWRPVVDFRDGMRRMCEEYGLAAAWSS